MPQASKKVSNKVTVIIILILGIVAFALKNCKKSNQHYSERSLTTASGDWRHHKLIYTSHARCRMECRKITQDEIENILSTGIVNDSKSKEEDAEAEGHCPTYALEGNTKDGQHVRIIFGACDKVTKVITAIDLDEEHPCNCR